MDEFVDDVDEDELDEDSGLLFNEIDVFLFRALDVLVIFPALNVVAVAATLVRVGLRVKPF